ncbi:DUF3800 domain-containing protein [Paenibacillus sp. GM2]|uniref:DUF3800 domain-containing protein n=1 Tax=Paenibacillus sp. GM2 TaxID=1622070 RepID=UPI0009ECEEC4|nr:DUF3800 domain-containing protein [Paenibacillus sp. GM2]
MHTHIAFLDESGDHSMQHIDLQFPVFALGSVIFEREYYYNLVNPTMDGIKYKYWKHRNIIFHSVDIRKQRGMFNILRDREIRTHFLDDITGFVSGLDYKIIAAGINKSDHFRTYAAPANPYVLTLEFVMERLYFYFKGSGNKALLIAESREDADNERLYNVFKRLMEFGNKNISSAEFKSCITDLEFIPKINNENGNQLTDLIIYPIARKIISRAKGYQSYIEIKPKFYTRSNGDFWGYGLKAFPSQTYQRIKQEED